MPLRRLRRKLRRTASDVALRVRPGAATAEARLVPPPFEPVPVRLLVGAANFAGQATAWGRAAERHLPGVSVRTVAVERPLTFPVDLLVPQETYAGGTWGRFLEDFVLDEATHVAVESLRPLFGHRNGIDCRKDVEILQRHGIATAMIFHGSDVRLPSRHAELYPWSPFTDDEWDLVPKLQAQVTRFLGIVEDFGGPTFVSTPDLLDFVPDAAWLPTVVDPSAWRTELPVLEREVPVVLHAPSNPHLKGSAHVEPVLERLQAEGLVEYRRIERVQPHEMPALVADADIVLEQFVLGLYSVAAIEAMAAGRVVLAHVHERVRERLPRPLPVVEADPKSLESVLRDVLADRERYRSLAAEGVAYATEVHDGRRSAQVLGDWLQPRR